MMVSDDIREFLEQRLIARMTTLRPDGYPHTVPVWYMLDGVDLLIATGEHARKLSHIRLHPRGAIVIGGDPLDENITYEPCYLFQGDYVLEGEPGFEGITRIARRYRDDHAQTERDIAAWGPHQMIRFKIRTVVKVM